MSLNELTLRDAVLQAIAEFDALGRKAFLERHGFGPSKAYYIRHEGKYYDSKAVAGVAFGKQFPGRGALKSDQFSGGKGTVQATFERLRFEVEKRPKIPL